MTPKQRFLAAVNHQEPDRVPMDSNGCVSAIHEVAYRRLLGHLQIDEEVSVHPDCLAARPSEAVLRVLDTDTRYVFPGSNANYTFHFDEDGYATDEFGVKYRRLGYYTEMCVHPLKDMTFSEIRKYKFPEPSSYNLCDDLRERVLRTCDVQNYAIVYGPVYCVFYILWMLRGFQQAVEDVAANRDIMRYIFDKATDWIIGMFEGPLNAIGDHLDMFWVGEDLGTQYGPMINPRFTREELVPRFQKIISFCKSKTKAKCVFHSCGSVHWALPYLIDMGVDIVHPVQPNAEGNGDSFRIKREFGDRLSFHGGTDNQGTFHLDKRIMLLDTLGRIKAYAPGGGYIFSSGHNIQATVPPENILALFECGREFGKYPIDVARIDARMAELRESLAQQPVCSE